MSVNSVGAASDVGKWDMPKIPERSKYIYNIVTLFSSEKGD